MIYTKDVGDIFFNNLAPIVAWAGLTFTTWAITLKSRGEMLSCLLPKDQEEEKLLNLNETIILVILFVLQISSILVADLVSPPEISGSLKLSGLAFASVTTYFIPLGILNGRI